VLVERAYAKINLTLDVLGKRLDGYHEIDMVMQTVELSDVVWVSERMEDTIQIDSTSSQMPLDERNLAHVAAREFFKYAGFSRGIQISIDKHIPVAAGLAGGSSDAAAVLRGLNRLFNTGYSLEQLAKLGAAVGSDVPFCVYGGCAIARGRGENIERCVHDMKAWAVLVRPPVFVSTVDVYTALGHVDAQLQTGTPSSRVMIQALQAGDFDAVVRHVGNDLRHAAEKMYPEISEYASRMQSTVGQSIFMSGSGPTLYLLAPSQQRAQRLYNALRGFMKEVYMCRLV